MKTEPTLTERLANDLRVIRNYTSYDMIEIEQTNRRVNKLQGIQTCHYRVKMDDTDPENQTIEQVYPEIIGGEIVFVDNPYPRKPVGTGKVAYLVVDDKDVPVGALSGEIKGWNLEFLAAHYAAEWFKIIDPKWDEIVRKRHEEILKRIEEMPKPKHRFDRRYAVRGAGTFDDRVKIEVEHPQAVQELIASFQKKQEEWDREKREMREMIEKMATRASEVKPEASTAPEVEEEPKKRGPKPKGVSNFVE